MKAKNIIEAASKSNLSSSDIPIITNEARDRAMVKVFNKLLREKVPLKSIVNAIEAFDNTNTYEVRAHLHLLTLQDICKKKKTIFIKRMKLNHFNCISNISNAYTEVTIPDILRAIDEHIEDFEGRMTLEDWTHILNTINESPLTDAEASKYSNNERLKEAFEVFNEELEEYHLPYFKKYVKMMIKMCRRQNAIEERTWLRPRDNSDRKIPTIFPLLPSNKEAVKLLLQGVVVPPDEETERMNKILLQESIQQLKHEQGEVTQDDIDEITSIIEKYDRRRKKPIDNIGPLYCIAPFRTKMEYLRPFIDFKEEEFIDDIELFRMYGPCNPMWKKEDNHMCNTFYAGCRMLLCDYNCNYKCDSDDDILNEDDYERTWFKGECDGCGVEIEKEEHCLRLPLRNGSWDKCLCGKKCLIASITCDFQAVMVGSMLSQLDEFGIYY